MVDDGARVRDGARVGAGVQMGLLWNAHWLLEKWIDRPKEGAPDEVIEFKENGVPNIGGAAIWDLVTGEATYTAFNNANAYLGVGDSSTAFDPAQTDLQAAVNKLRKAMNATYPSYVTMVVTFQSDFTSAEANFTWNEVGTFNAAAAGQMLNRKVQALGTKSSGSTWTLTLTITLSNP